MHLSLWKRTTDDILNNIGYEPKIVLIKNMIENNLVSDLKNIIYNAIYERHREKQLIDFYIPHRRFILNICNKTCVAENLIDELISDTQGVNIYEVINKTDEFIEKAKKLEILNWYFQQ